MPQTEPKQTHPRCFYCGTSASPYGCGDLLKSNSKSDNGESVKLHLTCLIELSCKPHWGCDTCAAIRAEFSVMVMSSLADSLIPQPRMAADQLELKFPIEIMSATCSLMPEVS